MATAEILDPEIAETVLAQHPIERFLLNFFGASFVILAAYSFLNILPLLQPIGLFPAFLGDLIQKVYSTLWTLFIPPLLGLIVAVYWEWKKPGPKRLAKYQFWMTAVIRYFLAYVFLTYGFAKVFEQQFSLNLSTLDTPLGQLTGMELTWRFFGYSYAYTLFVASSQIISSILFFFRRTTILGAMVLLPVISNIVFVNFSHHIPVKLMSSIYLALTLFLLAQDHRRLKALLWDNKPFGKPEFATMRLSKPLTIAKFGVVLVLIALPIAGNHASYQKYNVRTTPLYGSWDVQTYQVNGETGPESDLLAWKKVYFESDTLVAIRYPNKENAPYYLASLNNYGHTISLKGFRAKKPYFEGSYQLDGDKLTIDGKNDKNQIHAVLVRVKTIPSR